MKVTTVLYVALGTIAGTFAGSILGAEFSNDATAAARMANAYNGAAFGSAGGAVLGGLAALVKQRYVWQRPSVFEHMFFVDYNKYYVNEGIVYSDLFLHDSRTKDIARGTGVHAIYEAQWASFASDLPAVDAAARVSAAYDLQNNRHDIPGQEAIDAFIQYRTKNISLHYLLE